MNAEDCMRAAIAEARKAVGQTGPNPAVGAVVVRDGDIVARGYHHKAGMPHAEIEAMRDARDKGVELRGATVVVTLEPCNHTGRTGPCSEALIAAGVSRVIYGCSDPNAVATGGLARLRAAGVTVDGPVLEGEATALVRDFRLSMRERRPWIIAKLATSIDGRVATKTGESKWITSEASRAIGRQLRGQVQAIAAGVGTVLADDPLLTRRDGGPEPLRVIFDSRLRTPPTAKALPGSVVATGVGGELPGADVWTFPNGPEALAVAERLYKERGVMRLLIEGGPTLIGAFRDAGLIDELHLFMAPVVFGGNAKSAVSGDGVSRIAEAMRMRLDTLDRIDDDLHAVYVRR